MDQYLTEKSKRDKKKRRKNNGTKKKPRLRNKTHSKPMKGESSSSGTETFSFNEKGNFYQNNKTTKVRNFNVILPFGSARNINSDKFVVSHYLIYFHFCRKKEISKSTSRKQ